MTALLCGLGLLPMLRPTAAQEGGLSPGGPWVIYTARDGLIAANADGSGRTALALQAAPSPEGETPPPEELLTFRAAPAPSGDRLILITQNLEVTLGHEPSADLRLISLPGGGARTLLTNLLPDTPSAAYSSIVAALEGADPQSDLAWMPSGEGFAFVSGHEGLPDLYLYHVGSGASTRLTESAAIPSRPMWSPNGRRLLWEERRDPRSRLPDAIMTMAFASASGRSAAAGPAPLDLGLPPGQSWVLLGWHTPDRLLYSVEGEEGGLQGLYAYDFIAGQATTLLPPQVRVAPLTTDPFGEEVLVPVPPGQPGLPGALYRLDPASGTRHFYAPVQASALRWEPLLNAFVVWQGEAIALLPPETTEPTPLPATGDLIPAPEGSNVVFYRDSSSRQGPGLTVTSSPDAEPMIVWEGESTRPVWAPDGQHFYVFVADEAAPSGWQLMRWDGAAPGTLTPFDAEAVPGLLLALGPREVRVLADVGIEFRDAPSPNAGIIAILGGQEPIAAMLGRNRAGDWLAIRLADGRDGWVRAAEMSYSGDAAGLTILAE